jgi:hypothetical protein
MSNGSNAGEKWCFGRISALWLIQKDPFSVTGDVQMA